MANLFLIWPSVLPSVRFFNISIPLPSVFSFTLCWGPKFCNPQLCEARPAWLIFNSTHTLVDFQPPPHVFASLNAKGCSILKCWGARDGETFPHRGFFPDPSIGKFQTPYFYTYPLPLQGIYFSDPRPHGIYLPPLLTCLWFYRDISTKPYNFNGTSLIPNDVEFTKSNCLLYFYVFLTFLMQNCIWDDMTSLFRIMRWL